MAQVETNTVRIKVSPEIASIVKPGAPREAQMEAARGALPFTGKALLTVLFFLCRSQDVEIRKTAIRTLREVPETIFTPVLKDDTLPPQLLDLLARARLTDVELMAAVIMHPATILKTFLCLAEKGCAGVLERLVDHQDLLFQNPELIEAVIANPAATKALKSNLGWQDREEVRQADSALEPDQEGVSDDEVEEEDEGISQPEIAALMEEADQEGLSKYQIALELKVAEKIKMGITGDKEWRTIMMKESNKLVQAAVMKNPRITDGEVLMVVKNKTTSDDLIRLVLLNKEWIKNYEIKKALIMHPKTPPPKALRFVSFLTMKDIKLLAKSRQLSNIVLWAIRKEMEIRIKKTGG